MSETKILSREDWLISLDRRAIAETISERRIHSDKLQFHDDALRADRDTWKAKAEAAVAIKAGEKK